MTLNEFIARACSFFDKAEANPAADILSKAQTDLAASTAENTTLKAQAAESAKRVTDLEANLAAKDSEIATLKAEVDKAKGEKTKAETKADEVIAGQGIAADNLPEAGKTAGATSAKTLGEQLLEIKDPAARTAFYRKHKAEISAGK